MNTQQKQHPSVEKRRALRHAVRNHPDVRQHLAGRRVNELTLSELNDLAAKLGIGDVQVTPTGDETETGDNTVTGTGDDAVDTQLETIRDLVMGHGFSAADPLLRKLIADANKPATVIEIEVPTTAQTDANGATIVNAKPTEVRKPWSALFNVKGTLGKNTSQLWDGAHIHTPRKDDLYVWQQPATPTALTQIARGRNVFLYGPPGTGKTTWAKQLAATLGRPFALINCDDQTDGPTLIGMTVPHKDGGVTWQDGALTRAIQIPGCVICIDEPSAARAGALMALQNVLEDRVLYITETGRRVPVAKGVIFIACDNTNGTGGGARHGFTGTGKLNDANRDRYGAYVHFEYLSPAREAQTIVGRTGCTRALADLLVGAATLTRQEASKGAITNGISLRRLTSWAELLTDGIAPRAAFEAAVANYVPEADREAVTQQCLLAYDPAKIGAAMDPTSATNIAPTNDEEA